jgi:hypothetical protein
MYNHSNFCDFIVLCITQYKFYILFILDLKNV